MNAKDRIFQAAVELLNEETNPDDITVRRIAERAGVGIGAVNYHFQSKDNLLNQAVGALMQAEADRWLAPTAPLPDDQQSDADDPVARLRALLTHTARIGLRYPHLLEIAIRYELEQGQFSVANTVLPLLREFWAGQRTEAEIRLAALQLIVSIQTLYLRRDEVTRFTGYRLDSADEMERMVNQLIDNMLCQNDGRAGTGAEKGESK